MAMRKRRRVQQESLFIATQSLARAPGHPFYERLNALFAEHGFDDFVETLCAPYYVADIGRPSVPPGVYFRMLMIGYFEGLASERGIAWRVSDSLSLRHFLGYTLSESTPDHSTLSRTRDRLPVEVHDKVFEWILAVLAQEGLLKGRTVSVDGTTLEANAAMRSLVRRDTGESYRAYLEGLARAAGHETPTRQDLARIDKGRKRKASNQDWQDPHDPDARVTKMKDGRTHLAHKVEHVVDLQTQAVLAVQLSPADAGDTQTVEASLAQAHGNLGAVAQHCAAAAQLAPRGLQEVVADKGYHSNETLKELQQQGLRTYISEPERGRRCWRRDQEAQAAVYANRRRCRGRRGRALQRRRAEYTERSFAHTLESGALRRVYLRGHSNIHKRLCIHAGAFNLGLVMRQRFGAGSPRGLYALCRALHALRAARRGLYTGLPACGGQLAAAALAAAIHLLLAVRRNSGPPALGISTGC
jgi:transposase